MKEPADNQLKTVVRPPKNFRPDKHMKATTMPTTYTPYADESDLTFDEMMLLDIYYIENWSATLDLMILFKTIPTIILGSGAY